MMNAAEEREVSLQELVAIFDGKYVNIQPTDYITIYKATVTKDEDDRLHFVSRDSDGNVTGLVCVTEDSIESIKEYGGTYTINLIMDMASMDISEYRTLEQS